MFLEFVSESSGHPLGSLDMSREGQSDQCRRHAGLRGPRARGRVTNAEGTYRAPGANGRPVPWNQVSGYM